MKKKTVQEILDEWEDATNEIARIFTSKYYPNEVFLEHTFWIGDRVGGIYSVSDCFFDIERMRESLELNATFDQVYDYHWLEIELDTKEPPETPPVSFRDYVKYGLPTPQKQD